MVRQPDGARLVAFLDPGDGPPPNVAVTGALTILRHQGRVLLVFTRDRRMWELPGGSIEQGETAEECARRETLEESGQAAEALTLRGWAVWFAPQMATGRSECCAVFEGAGRDESPFTPTDEIERIAWAAPGGEPEDLAAIDRKLLDIATR